MASRDAAAGKSEGASRARITGALADVAILFAAKIAIDVLVLRSGFTHVSDDDYARVVIAEQFAHAPHLDPSGTSWLPFPFWTTGLGMLLFGRTLETARALACVFGVVSVAAPYAAMRAAGCGRVVSVAATAFAMALPWSAWLGVATVPEAPAAALIACGALATAAPEAFLGGALALLAASLSRYEAWPVCAVLALVCLARRRWAAAAVAIAGPLLWMAWNAHAHGSAVHFLARVAAYRQSIGAADVPLVDKLTAYPRALAATSPLALLLGAAGVVALVRDRTVRQRWTWPLVAALATLAFLVYGDLHDGAPTHHPERAIVPVVWIVGAFGVDGAATCVRLWARGRALRESMLVGLGVALSLAWAGLLPDRYRDRPASSPSEARASQIARGEALARAGVPALTVTPCAYEHFALMAAYGAPERVTITPHAGRPAADPSGDECPNVEIR